jgi:hypothetical protein
MMVVNSRNAHFVFAAQCLCYINAATIQKGNIAITKLIGNSTAIIERYYIKLNATMVADKLA